MFDKDKQDQARTRLLSWIRANPLSMRELARLIGVAPITMRNFITDNRRATYKTLGRIEKFLSELKDTHEKN